MNKSSTSSTGVQRQIKLPLSKAVEIAYKSLRLRLARSMVVTTGITLALAFLISIMAGDAMIDGMRRWISETTASPRFAQLQEQRRTLEQELHQLEVALRRVAVTPPAKTASKDPAVEHYQRLKEAYGSLPLPAMQLAATMNSGNAGSKAVAEWEAAAVKMVAIRAELNAPQLLEALMKQRGVAMTPQELQDNRIRNRWLISLALLVAFVGILNSMIMSVTERFREIGTMKCLGALDGFIIKLFLLESLFQGAVGTIIGVILGLALSLLSATISYGGAAWRNVPVEGLFAAVGVTFVVGLGLTVAGAIYPAWQAARMHPIEAMRVEA